MTKAKEFDDGYERPPSPWVKWGKIGDAIKGTYIGNVDRVNKDGSKQHVYEIKAEAGSYFYFEKQDDSSIKMDKDQTIVEPGQIYLVGGKKIIDNIMRRARIGQKVLFRFVDTYKMPQGIAKTIEVKLGGMDEDYIDETKSVDDEIKVDEVAFD